MDSRSARGTRGETGGQRKAAEQRQRDDAAGTDRDTERHRQRNGETMRRQIQVPPVAVISEGAKGRWSGGGGGGGGGGG